MRRWNYCLFDESTWNRTPLDEVVTSVAHTPKYMYLYFSVCEGDGKRYFISVCATGEQSLWPTWDKSQEAMLYSTSDLSLEF